MKKIILSFLVISALFFRINVFAEDKSQIELIPINTNGSVDTEKFLYQNISFNNNIIKFDSITNKSNVKDFVSINVLLFDKDEKNIGLVSYCSKRDYDSEFAGRELSPNEAIPFSIKVSDKYFVKDKSVNDVSFIAIKDENKYCQIGGYEKYEGLTLKQIESGLVASNLTEEGIALELFSFFKGKGFIIIIIAVLILLIILIVNGILLNALYKRMYAKKTSLAYLPFFCNYVAVKLSFGELIGKIYFIALIFSGLLSFVGLKFILSLMNIISFVSYIVVIIKLITKKYDLFYYDPVNSVNKEFTSTKVEDSNFINQDMSLNNEASSIEPSPTQVVDFKYDHIENEDKTDIFNGGNISTGNNNLINNIPNFTNQNMNETNKSEENNSNKDESDLSKFFR